MLFCKIIVNKEEEKVKLRQDKQLAKIEKKLLNYFDQFSGKSNIRDSLEGLAKRMHYLFSHCENIEPRTFVDNTRDQIDKIASPLTLREAEFLASLSGFELKLHLPAFLASNKLDHLIDLNSGMVHRDITLRSMNDYRLLGSAVKDYVYEHLYSNRIQHYLTGEDRDLIRRRYDKALTGFDFSWVKPLKEFMIYLRTDMTFVKYLDILIAIDKEDQSGLNKNTQKLINKLLRRHPILMFNARKELLSYKSKTQKS